MFKKILRKLMQFDFVWSVPLAFASFVAYGIFGELFFGEGFGFYDPSFFQAALYATLVTILFNGATLMGVLINFNGAYNYYLYKSKTEFEGLPPIQKMLIFLGLYGFLMLLQYFIWVKIV